MERIRAKLELDYLNRNDICLDKDGMYLFGNKVLYNDILKAKVMLVNELSSIGSTYANVNFNYYLDLDIYTDKKVYLYQVDDKHLVNELFTIFNDQGIEIEDVLDLQKVYQEYPDFQQRYEYYRFKYRDWAKMYNLDNPRGIKSTNDIKNKY